MINAATVQPSSLAQLAGGLGGWHASSADLRSGCFVQELTGNDDSAFDLWLAETLVHASSKPPVLS